MPEERLQKILAAAGVASRRASESLIASGRVRVNGRIASIGDQADAATAQIEVDGILVGVGAARIYVALHKPAGVTSTTHDRHADTTVLDLVPTALTPDGTRLYPVGRLDRDSEGLLLLTNDGTWADHVLHPRFGVQREYAVALERPLDHDQAALLRAGIQLEEGLATLAAPLRPATAIETRTLSELLHPAPHPELVWYRAVIAQGWKRQLRRMFAAAGTPILRLVRVRIGTVRLDRLSTGRARLLRAPEIRQLGTVPGAVAQRRSGPMTAATSGPGRRATPPGASGPAPTSGPRPVRQKGAPGSSGPRRPAPKPKAGGTVRSEPRADEKQGQRHRSRPGKPGLNQPSRPPSKAREGRPEGRTRRGREDYPPER
ncbi:MAG: pseudouridine synthase [Chloroflexota bacterium]